MTEDEIEAHLGAVFDELIELIGETKQAAWTARSRERHRLLDDLKTFLAEQAVLIDDAELRLGARAPWVTSPTAHHTRNMADEAGGDSERVVELLVRDFRIVIEDLRRRATAIDDEWQALLSGLADDLERHVDAL
jgi:DNA-binding ferritin-like protein